MSTFPCDLCNKVFKLKTDLERHKEKKTPCVTADKIVEKHKNEILETKIKVEDVNKIKKFFEECHNILRDKEGIIGMKALNNISMLLFLKFINNSVKEGTIDLLNIEKYRGKEGEKDQGFQKYKNYIKYCDMTKIIEDGKFKVDINEIPIIIEYIFRHILQRHPKTSNIFKDEIPTIKYEKTYEKILKDLDKLKLDEIDVDIKGLAYELFLKYETGGGSLGQFFTRREVVDYMITKIKPFITENSKIIDPFMGTGGFITHMFNVIKKIYHEKNISFTDEKKNNLMNGIEKNPQTFLLALNNMLLNSDVYPNNLKCDDSFRNYIDEKYDFVLTNPPFGIDGLSYDDTDMFPDINETNKIKKKDYIPIKSSDAICLALQMIPFILKKNGIAAIIVPDGKQMTNEKEKSLVEVRKLLIENNNLYQITKLPSGTFLPYTGVDTIILFLKKGEITKKIKYVKLENDYKTEKTLCTIDIKELREKKYTLNYKAYVDINKVNYQNLEYKLINDIVTFLPKSKRLASYGNPDGKYPFYTSSAELTKYCDEYDYSDEAIIIGTGGNANVKIAKNFSCSADNIIIKTNADINNKYLYYYLMINIDILENLFHGTTIKHLSKNDFMNLKIPVPSIEIQDSIIKELDLLFQEKERMLNSIRDTVTIKQIHFDSLIEKCKNKKKTKLVELIKVSQGEYLKKENMKEGNYPIYGGGDVSGYLDKYNRESKYIISKDGVSLKCVRYVEGKFFLNHHAWTFEVISDNTNSEFIGRYLIAIQENIYKLATGTAQKGINQENFYNLAISLPSIKEQEEIINEMKKHDVRVSQQQLEIELINKLIKERFEHYLQKFKDNKIKDKKEDKINETTDDVLSDSDESIKSDDKIIKKKKEAKKIKVKSKKIKKDIENDL